MDCPKCRSEMDGVEVHGVTIKRCHQCKGLWFDRAKHEYLRKVKDSRSIDDGDPAVGRTYNAKDQILCPDCSAPMIRMVVPDQHHIWYESCSKCFSVFFDAGEFKDYVRKDLVDIIQDLFTPER
ncbi:MAG: hypothetical protein A3I78_01850 [Gammaproteobacteria bacterium RIFCSPLOWO2_02_FULL_56_15]|nr:MAG: hypothetical protein A3I78_01850 [Gammaproteobacteria bacterium RIFCSPLOWO2_02_FULL_56_15]